MLPWLDEHLRTRGGALVASAEAFSAWSRGLNGAAPPQGGDGIVALARRLAAFVYEPDVDDEDERRFVEGAGALLGLLLIARSPAGCHRQRGPSHLVQLSQYGYFDPFRAVDSALSADSVRLALVRAVGEAEAEICGSGPLSRMVAAFLEQLAAHRPGYVLAEQFATELVVTGPSGERVGVDLAKAVAATAGAPLRSVALTARKLVSMLPGGENAADSDFAAIRGVLFPRVIAREALAELSQRVGAELACVPLAGELCAALVVEQSGRARYVRGVELERWGLSSRAALGVATENLAQASTRTRLHRENTEHGPIYVLRTGDGRDSARVLLHELRPPLAERVGPLPAFTLPHRDVLLVCDGRVGPLVDLLRERTEHDAARAPHRVSTALYTLEGDGLVVLDSRSARAKVNRG
jgi:hypothetical protein